MSGEPAALALVDRLVRETVSLAPLLYEHRAENFDEVLPHVFLAEVARHVTHAIERAAVAPADEARDVEVVLRVLEAEMSSGPEEVRDLVVLSFLANLSKEIRLDPRVRDHIGPSLRAAVREF